MVYGLDPTLQTSATGGGIDANTGETFGEIMAKNSASQALQQQQVQQAMEQVKQARLGTQMKQEEFDTKSFLSAQGLMQKSQALGMLRIVWEKQGLPDDKIEERLAKANEELPEELDGRSLYQFWTVMKEIPPQKTKEVIATKSDVDRGQVDNAGRLVEEGRSYLIDADDNWRLSGKDAATIEMENKLKHPPKPAAAPTTGPGSKQDIHDWRAIVKEMDPTGASSRNALGQGYNSLVASLRGEFLLDQPTVTYENMAEVSRDLTRILQQGVPSDAGAEAMTYHTLMGDIQRKLQYLSGQAQDALPANLKLYLKESFERLRATSMDILDYKIQQKEDGLPDLITANRPAWDKLVFGLRHPPTHWQDAYRAKTQGANAPAAASSRKTALPPGVTVEVEP